MTCYLITNIVYVCAKRVLPFMNNSDYVYIHRYTPIAIA